MNRGTAGSRSSPGNAASGPASTADVVTAGKASTLLVTTGVLPVQAGSGGRVDTTRREDVVGSWTVEVPRTGVVSLSVAATLSGTAVIIVGLLGITAVVVGAAVARVTGCGVTGLVVGGAEVGSLNWGREGLMRADGTQITERCCYG